MTVLNFERPAAPPVVETWTGAAACALQAALRMTYDGFADHIGFARRTVGTWHERPDRVLRRDAQSALDTVYERLTDAERARFVHSLGESDDPREPDEPPVVAKLTGFIGVTYGEDEPQVVADFGGGPLVLGSLDVAELAARTILRQVAAARLGAGVAW